MKIKVNCDNCTGCRLCQQICAIKHYGEINPKKAALKIAASFPSPGKYRPLLCIQCGKCAESCPQEAIKMNREGAYIVDKDLCNNCGVCISNCKTGVIFQHPDIDHVIICDLCFECVSICNTAALVRVGNSDKDKGRLGNG
ncbi:MAG: 4Fe-4S dicluster domain-containing protein [Syntrophales bacterium]